MKKQESKIKSGIGYSALTEQVYYGKQNESKGMWIGEKKDITQDFIHVLMQYVPEGTTRELKGVDTGQSNILINVRKDAKSIEAVIKYLQKQLNK